MKLSAEQRQVVSIGKVINIMSTGVGRCDRIFMPLSQLVSSPVIVSVALWQIYTRYGNAMFGAFLGACFFTLLNVFQGRIMGMLRGKIAGLADKRIRHMSELVNAMRVVKMYVWEGHFLQKLIASRKKEMKKHRVRLGLYGIMDSISRTTSKYLITIAVAIYFSISNIENFRTSDLFAVSMFLKTIEDNLRSLLNVAMHYAELRNCCHRINHILLLPEHTEHAIHNKAFTEIDSMPKTAVEGVNARHPGTDSLALNDVSFNIPPGKITGIVGPVGSGKSSIFSLLLNELQMESGTFPSYKSFGYSAQESWIITGTIRDNIIMGRPFVQERYDEVLNASCLKSDLEDRVITNPYLEKRTHSIKMPNGRQLFSYK